MHLLGVEDTAGTLGEQAALATDAGEAPQAKQGQGALCNANTVQPQHAGTHLQAPRCLGLGQPPHLHRIGETGEHMPQRLVAALQLN